MPEVRFSGAQFAEALDRIVSDPEFREALRTRPTEMLPELGIEIEDRDRAERVAQRLVRGGERAAARAGAELPDVEPLITAEPSVNVLVFAAIEPAVDSAVEVVAAILVDREVEEALEKIQDANVRKMRERLLREEEQ